VTISFSRRTLFHAEQATEATVKQTIILMKLIQYGQNIQKEQTHKKKRLTKYGTEHESVSKSFRTESITK